MSGLGNFFLKKKVDLTLQVAEVSPKLLKRPWRQKSMKPEKFKVFFHQDHFPLLDINKGELVAVISPSAKRLLAFALPLSRFDTNKKIVRMNEDVRENLNVQLGNYVTIEKILPPEAQYLEIQPVGFKIRPTERFLQSFRHHFKDFPLSRGSIIYVDLGICRRIPIKITNVQPAESCLLGEKTVIKIRPPEMKLAEAPGSATTENRAGNTGQVEDHPAGDHEE